jgi:hypothetical protein
VLYDKLTARTYVRWLHRMSVRYVVVTDAAPDYSARHEIALLQGGRSGLDVVHVSPNAVVYGVPSPQPLVTGPGRPTVKALTESTITLALPRGGEYHLGIRYTPYLRSPRSCVSEAKDGMTLLSAPRGGTLKLRFDVTTKAALAALTGRRTTCPGS